jgi:diguanylate cyclase (GGDEF)-like protein
MVPGPVWIALAAALAIAAAGGAAGLGIGRRTRRRARTLGALRSAACTDPLTGLLNRRGFTEAARRELTRALRYHRPLALAYVDVRGLKRVNDTQGHLAGDGLIKQVADLLKASARTNDVVGRLGGDELAVLLTEQSAQGAATVAARIRAMVLVRQQAQDARAPLGPDDRHGRVPDDGEALDALLAVADRRLYEQRGIQLR